MVICRIRTIRTEACNWILSLCTSGIKPTDIYVDIICFCHSSIFSLIIKWRQYKYFSFCAKSNCTGVFLTIKYNKRQFMRIFKRIFSFPQLGFLSLHGLVCLWKCSGIYLEDQDNYSFYVYCLASQNLSLKTGFPSVMRTPPCPCYIMRIYCHHFMLVFVVNSVYNCIRAHLFAL